MSNYRKLLLRARELDAQIAKAREAEAAAVLEDIRARVTEFGFTVSDVFPVGKRKRKRHERTGPTYRDPVSGATWSGMGRAPGWIKDTDRSKFIVKPVEYENR